MLTHDIICQRIPLDQSLTAMLPVTLKRHPTQSWLFHEFGRLRGPLPFSENHPGLYRQCRMFYSSVKLKKCHRKQRRHIHNRHQSRNGSR